MKMTPPPKKTRKRVSKDMSKMINYGFRKTNSKPMVPKSYIFESGSLQYSPTTPYSYTETSLTNLSTPTIPYDGNLSEQLINQISESDYIYETRELVDKVNIAEEFIGYLKDKYNIDYSRLGTQEGINNKFRLSLQPKKTQNIGIMVTDQSISEDYAKHLVSEEKKYTKCTPEEQNEIYNSLGNGGVTLDLLINWGDLYHTKKRITCGRINLKLLYHLQKPLKDLRSMIGLEKFKANVIEQILMCLQGLHIHPNKNNDEMFHTVIYGPPGVGKTQLARILGHIYIAMGLIYKRPVDLNNFKIDDYFETASRSDLIGMFCGHTAVQTQKIIDNCRKKGKVLFIDETYSLGDKEGRDNFSKECIDTINSNLTDGAGEFICIIAGYPEDIKKCFFAHNKGLERRFNFRYTVDKYSPAQLFDIFRLKLKEGGWELLNDQVVTSKLFEDNQDYFTNCGGDIVAFLTKCRIVYSNRVFFLQGTPDRKLTKEDINRAMELFKIEREDSAKSHKVKREKEKHDKEMVERMFL